jgi:drug/metabolite transporter (DMT)-like permease
MFYGLYTAFITLAMSRGVWDDWYGQNLALLSAFTVTYVIGAIGSGINYSLSALWSIGIGGVRGKLRDVTRSLKTKPGRILVLAALIGGPISTTAYVVALQLAGSIAIPIAALCPAIGAILSRIFYKQKLNLRMICGILICLVASVLIAIQGLDVDAAPQMFLGIMIMLIAAIGWGFEGCVGGYATAFVDYEVGIVIRQVTSGVAALLILAPVLALFGGNIGEAFVLTGRAIADSGSFPIFIISGFFTVYAFNLWYKGNSMCGTALGMAANGTFSFWAPLACWLILGVALGMDGWALPPIAWFAAVLMFVGILFIAVNPLKLFSQKEEVV